MASQNKEEAKIKFIEYVQPINVLSNNCYKADGRIERAVQQQSDLSYQTRVDDESVLRFGGNCGKPFEIPFGGQMIQLCKDRERNLDPSGYIRNGSMVGRGFGQVDTFSQIQFGETTRQMMSPAEETEIDRIHPLNRNFNVMGFYPYPKDTRSMNKTYSQQ